MQLLRSLGALGLLVFRRLFEGIASYATKRAVEKASRLSRHSTQYDGRLVYVSTKKEPAQDVNGPLQHELQQSNNAK